MSGVGGQPIAGTRWESSRVWVDVKRNRPCQAKLALRVCNEFAIHAATAWRLLWCLSCCGFLGVGGSLAHWRTQGTEAGQLRREQPLLLASAAGCRAAPQDARHVLLWHGWAWVCSSSLEHPLFAFLDAMALMIARGGGAIRRADVEPQGRRADTIPPWQLARNS